MNTRIRSNATRKNYVTLRRYSVPPPHSTQLHQSMDPQPTSTNYTVDSDEVLVLTEQGSWEAPLAPVPTEKPQAPPSPETPSACSENAPLVPLQDRQKPQLVPIPTAKPQAPPSLPTPVVSSEFIPLLPHHDHQKAPPVPETTADSAQVTGLSLCQRRGRKLPALLWSRLEPLTLPLLNAPVEEVRRFVHAILCSTKHRLLEDQEPEIQRVLQMWQESSSFVRGADTVRLRRYIGNSTLAYAIYCTVQKIKRSTANDNARKLYTTDIQLSPFYGQIRKRKAMMLSHGRPDRVKNKEETNSLVAVRWSERFDFPYASSA
ncbi:Protein of unknown function [Pyronema omphalodes CBS 100304]|uniref:Uncharacterized protein n=1 Tax=Pyronema omphalodes (strain CBS 100304) TaxID=1076935 RepID=U4LW79_PYROM|nr:Protein of unknown function [Pyronema omphalodes CBS 100304]